MSHKKYLPPILGIALFALTGLVGFYASDWRTVNRLGTEEPFRLPVMPKAVLDEFSAEFSAVRAANEPMRLPSREILAPGGKPISFSSFEGKPLLINFWATWCAPCVVELPSLQKFAEHYKDRINVIAVSLDPIKKQPGVASFLEKRGISAFAGYFDESGVLGSELQLRGIPTSFLIGKNGQILYRFEGDADWTSASAREFFDRVLADSSNQTGE